MSLKTSPADLPMISMGQRGMDWIDTTSARTGDWCVIVALSDTIFTTLTNDPAAELFVNGSAGNLNGKALAKGLMLFGRFNAITLTSGTVVAYRT